ncbi:O-antigen ligase domain-containing protein [Peribacillus cavernae]|uniref:O-antigen ligase domain-containing protein n=1 Tax=Peribacillus cavernae TaxID=1674310 RepID=A0A433HT64_9BACI|nr:O-antigen ligase family protein [Peribacillus cavernae]MDQ0218432.1 teichuronic acid biosynthesis protein TuaE [Peribacillus cavernae]RUQ31434.1 O-antigen ligase domain-containing protein [Peribacillus cavernae]
MGNVLPMKFIQQMFVALILSIALGWGVVYHFDAVIVSISLLAAGILLLLVPFAFKQLIKRYSLGKPIIYLFVFSSFLGPGIISFRVGPISLFPYRILLPVAMLAALYYWLFKKEEHSIINRQPVKPVLLFLLGWLCFGFISLLWAESLIDGIKELVFLGLGIFLILLFTTFFNHRKDYTIVLYIWLTALLFIIVLGFWNHFTKQALPVSRMYDAPLYIRGRPTAVFKNENDLASFLALSVFLLLPFLHYSKRWMLKLIAVFMLLSSLYLINLTLSRANLLAVIIGALFWFLFFTTKKEKQYTLYAVAVVGIVGMVLFADRFLILFNDVFQTILSLFQPSQNPSDSNDIRVNLIKNALLFLSNTFGFGIGAGNIEHFINSHAKYSTMGTLNLHNWWIEILVQYGFIAFAGYVITYIWMIVTLLKLFFKSTNNQDRSLSEALCTTIVVFSLASISPSSIMTLNYSWVLWAFAIGYINFRYKNDLKQKPEGAI